MSDLPLYKDKPYRSGGIRPIIKKYLAYAFGLGMGITLLIFLVSSSASALPTISVGDMTTLSNEKGAALPLKNVDSSPPDLLETATIAKAKQEAKVVNFDKESFLKAMAKKNQEEGRLKPPPRAPLPVAPLPVVPPLALSSPQQNEVDGGKMSHIKSGKVKLLVGGSDGSGTRSVVDLLQSLGVTMVIDDTGTNDVHGAEMVNGKGWPDVVRPVLKETHSANYNVASLSQETVDFLRREIGYMNSAHEGKKDRWRRQNNGDAKFIDYGIKAPVSMLLVPMFREIWGRMKFIHVVRDGRDIAFSGNQSPVKKFYEDSFVDGAEEYNKWTGPMEPVRPMQLWNDWNADLLDWERGAAGDSFDYMVIRTEDLLEAKSKYKVLLEVKDFIGSDKGEKELCCMAKRGVKDMGSHSYSDRRDVRKRYGKWAAPLEANKALSDKMHEVGERGLKAFGYEPNDENWLEDFGDFLVEREGGGFVCDENVSC